MIIAEITVDGNVVYVGGKWFKRDPSIEAQADAFRLQAYEKLL